MVYSFGFSLKIWGLGFRVSLCGVGTGPLPFASAAFSRCEAPAVPCCNSCSFYCCCCRCCCCSRCCCSLLLLLLQAMSSEARHHHSGFASRHHRSSGNLERPGERLGDPLCARENVSLSCFTSVFLPFFAPFSYYLFVSSVFVCFCPAPSLSFSFSLPFLQPLFLSVCITITLPVDTLDCLNAWGLSL